MLMGRSGRPHRSSFRTLGKVEKKFSRNCRPRGSEEAWHIFWKSQLVSKARRVTGLGRTSKSKA